MTIDSSWIASFKEDSPESFKKQIPFKPTAAFCDGQIRLMRGDSNNLLTWDDYIWRQFHSHVSNFYRNHGVSTVILAFDDYAHVPEAKCMTQIKRRKNIPKIDFLEREPLPPVCPSGTRWDQCIANRVFKTKVILLVIQRLPTLLNLIPGQTLIIDYAGHPVAYRPGEGGRLETQTLAQYVPLGEADVKFTRYADLFRDLLVDSVDGDSVPIALLHHEQCVRDLTEGSMNQEDLTGIPPRICIYRITTRTSDDEVAKRPEKKAKTDSGTYEPKVARCNHRTFEYVNIPTLFDSIRDTFNQCMGRAGYPTHSPHVMAMLTALIGLTGTDFTRHIPQVSGKTVFGFLPTVLPLLISSFNAEENQLDVHSATNFLVSGIYKSKFETHLRQHSGPSVTLQTILYTLRTSKLSQRTCDCLPSVPQIECTVKNVNWLLHYWTHPETVPAPIDADSTFGFAKRKGVVVYADCA